MINLNQTKIMIMAKHDFKPSGCAIWGKIFNCDLRFDFVKSSFSSIFLIVCSTHSKLNEYNMPLTLDPSTYKV